eukprot:3074772-Amphidinium_carterae.1
MAYGSISINTLWRFRNTWGSMTRTLRSLSSRRSQWASVVWRVDPTGSFGCPILASFVMVAIAV